MCVQDLLFTFYELQVQPGIYACIYCRLHAQLLILTTEDLASFYTFCMCSELGLVGSGL